MRIFNVYRKATYSTAKWLAIGLASLLLLACEPEKPPLKSAPVGDRATLEKLASNYSRVSEQLPTTPMNLLPDQRKSFIEQVFRESGYNYSATLRDLALRSDQRADQLVKDLAQLVLMPHANIMESQVIAKLYSEQELNDVKKIEAILR